MSVLWIFVACCLFRGSRAVPHSLLGTYTAVNTDEFTCVLWLDGEAVDSYSSNGMDSVPRRNWMREGRGRSLWKSVKLHNMKHWDRGRTDILKNDTGLNMSGAAVLQGRFGCEIELISDSVNRTRTFAQYGWNGEDFLSFNLSRLQWEASAGSAVPITRKWNRDQDITMETKNYIDYICVHHLLISLSFEAEEGQETAQPTAAVFAKRSLNPGKVILTCLVSGFHCSNTTVEVYRDDDIITEEDGLLSSGIRPNGDGTCQLRKSLDISNSTEASYSCEVQFGSLKRLVKWDGKIWDQAEPKQDYDTRRHDWLLMVPLVLVIALSLVFLIWILRRRLRTQTKKKVRYGSIPFAEILLELSQQTSTQRTQFQKVFDVPMEPRFNETQPSGFIVLMPKENDHCKVQLGTTGLQRHHKETVQLEGQSITMRRRTDQLWAPLASGS